MIEENLRSTSPLQLSQSDSEKNPEGKASEEPQYDETSSTAEVLKRYDAAYFEELVQKEVQRRLQSKALAEEDEITFETEAERLVRQAKRKIPKFPLNSYGLPIRPEVPIVEAPPKLDLRVSVPPAPSSTETVQGIPFRQRVNRWVEGLRRQCEAAKTAGYTETASLATLFHVQCTRLHQEFLEKHVMPNLILEALDKKWRTEWVHRPGQVRMESVLGYVETTFGYKPDLHTALSELLGIAYSKSVGISNMWSEWMVKRQEVEDLLKEKEATLPPAFYHEMLWASFTNGDQEWHMMLATHIPKEGFLQSMLVDAEGMQKRLLSLEVAAAKSARPSQMSMKRASSVAAMTGFFTDDEEEGEAGEAAAVVPRQRPTFKKARGNPTVEKPCAVCGAKHLVSACDKAKRCKHGRISISEGTLTRKGNYWPQGIKDVNDYLKTKKVVSCTEICARYLPSGDERSMLVSQAVMSSKNKFNSSRYYLRPKLPLFPLPTISLPKKVPSQKTKVKVTCTVGSLQLTSLLDSGATYSIVSQRAYNELKRLQLVRTYPMSQTTVEPFLMTIDGRPLPRLERVLINNPLFNTEEGTKFSLPAITAFVMEAAISDLIIGRDYLDEVGFIIDFRKKKVLIDSHQVNTMSNSSPMAVVAALQAKPGSSSDSKSQQRQKVLGDMNALDLKHLEKGNREKLLSLLRTNWEAFAVDPDAPDETSEVKMSIDTGDAKPIGSKNRPIWGVKEAALKKQVDTWLKSGKIVRSRSPWTSQPLLIPKGEGWRVCVDFRALNAVTRSEDYPTPHVAVLLDKLKNSDWFSSLDLANAYLQIPLDEDSRAKTAFSTPWGKYEFCCVAFGLKNAPAVFNQYFAEVLSRVRPVPPVNFFDDTAVGTKGSFDQHLKMLSDVFKVVKEAKLQFKLAKCSFAREQIRFCGFIVSKRGVSPNTDAQSTINKMVAPKTVTEVQSFLGCINYFRHFIKDFAATSEPLYALTVKGVKFDWTENCEAAFRKLKQKLCEAPVLAYPEFEKIKDFPFRLSTDASNKGIGAVLEQLKEDKEYHPVNFASRALRAAEKHYSAIELECLALVWAMNKFKEFLEAGPFDVLTDHKPLTYMMTQWRNSNKRIQNWLLSVAELPLRSFHHVEGEKNVIADSLSRLLSEEKTLRELAELRNAMQAAITQGSEQLLYAMEETDQGSDPIGLREELAAVTTRTSKMSIQERNDLQIAKALQQNEQIRIGIVDYCSPPTEEECAILLEPMQSDKFPAVELLKARQKDDPVLKDIYEAVAQNLPREILFARVPILRSWTKGCGDVVYGLRKDGVLVRVSALGAVVIVPLALREKAIACAHSSLFSGHEGVVRTLRRLNRSCWWKSMSHDVEYFIDRCYTCKACNPGVQSGYKGANVRSISTSEEPGDVWHLDFVGPLPPSRKNQFAHVLVAIDEASGYVEVKAVHSPMAKFVISMMIELGCRWGAPSAFRSDNGAAFTAKDVRIAAKNIGAKWYEIPAGHPQSNGKVERANRTIKETLLKKLAETKVVCDWFDVLIPAVAALNTAYSFGGGGGRSPFEEMVGRAPKSIIDANWRNSNTDLEGLGSKSNPWAGLVEAKLFMKALRAQEKKSLEEKQLVESSRIRKYTIGEKVLVKHYGPTKTAQERFVTTGARDPFVSPQSLWRKGEILQPVGKGRDKCPVVYEVLLDRDQLGARGMGTVKKVLIMVHVHHLQPLEKVDI